MTVAIVNFGLCNLDSIARAVEECGGDALITDRREDIEAAGRIVIPGVGAFADAMRRLDESGLAEVLNERVMGHGVPCLGICLGMHVLAASGEEEGGGRGLGWIDGTVRRMRPAAGERIPHIGWNEVEPAGAPPLFEGVAAATDFYFVHSYHFICSDPAEVLATTPYCGSIASAVGRDNVLGVQFHPEKSQAAGFAVLTNFLERY